MKKLEEILGIKFNDIKKLELALTHSSYSNNNVKYKGVSNEKLEFMGDAVLELIITEHLYFLLPNKLEGELTRIRATIVCERALYEVAKKWSLGEFILMSNGEELTGGRVRPALLADCVEAIIAAIYLDKGYDTARDFVLKNLKEIIDLAKVDEIVLDHKTKLQELLQENGEVNIHYELIGQEGPPHKRKFYTKVYIDDITLGKGEGYSKKESEQDAARDALSKHVKKDDK